ncbi:MAG: EAL domain-containing protein, partial [Hyphomicrobium sp.]
GLIHDISDAKRAYERLLHDAVHCSLTGLPNRELFLDRLRGAVARAATDSDVRPAVLFIDIDKFKSANASFGLVRGDSLLLTVARRLQRHLGPHDTVARVGGDQFAMLFISEQDSRNLAALAERVRRSLRAPIPLANQEIVLTGSIGIAVWDAAHSGDDALLKEAELAMYRAKRGGADRIVAFEPEMRRDRDDRIQIESDLRKALERNQLKVLYQPIIYLPTKELAGFEALVRWEHPKLGLLNPVSFVPVAEESDLIIKLGSHVLLRAAKDAARWQTELPRAERPLFVSVNVSSRQVFRPEAVQEIRHVLGRNIVPKGVLRLEVTESLVMENPEAAAEALETLRGAGADLALDDFGTGYSSLAYLRRFPFDCIKIDRELVRGSSSPEGAAIMRSIVALAHELGKRIVAEGVEQPEEAAFLRSIGCEYAQGFHFGEPIPDRDVVQLLKMVRKSEMKMQPRGFFRPKTINRKGEDAADIVADEAAKSPEAQSAIAAAAALPPPSKAQTLPNTTVRQRAKTPVAEKTGGPASDAAAIAQIAPPGRLDVPMPMPAMKMPLAAAGQPMPIDPRRANGTQGGPPSREVTQGRPAANGNGNASAAGHHAPPANAGVPGGPGGNALGAPKPSMPMPRQPGPSAPPAMRTPPGPANGQYAGGGAMPPSASGGPINPQQSVNSAGNAGGNAGVRPLAEALARAMPPAGAAPPPLPSAAVAPPGAFLTADYSSLPPGVAASLARLAGIGKPQEPVAPADDATRAAPDAPLPVKSSG